MRLRGHIYIAFCILMLLANGCGNSGVEQAMKWRVTLDKEDKRPYGAYLAFESLKYFFPSAKIQTVSRGFRLGNMDVQMKYNDSGKTLMVFNGLDFYLTDKEWTQLKEFAIQGNEVFIFCSKLDNKIEDELNCYKRLGNEEMPLYYQAKAGGPNRRVLQLAVDTARYGYEGRAITGYFTQKTATSSFRFDQDTTHTPDESEQWVYSDTSETTADSSNEQDTYTAEAAGPPVPDTLGYTDGELNFVRYSAGEGHITLHAAPLVLSNYFLLQPGNERYLTGIWRTLPDDLTRVYWNDYFKRSSEVSSLEVLWRYPSTRLALQLGILALIIFVLFEGKRKQKIIPIVAPVKNDSVSFVETVGRLYYNKGNHSNLAEKMVQQYLEWVRLHYMLNTNLLNDQFIHQLTIRSGEPERTVRALVEMIHEVRLRSVPIDEAYLYQLYNTIQHFYKNHRK
ncbi:MAG: DUF4350 domain-containing protein [Bacteroidota bacterium]